MSQESQQASHDKMCNCGAKVLPEESKPERWYRTEDQLPTEGLVVDAMKSDGVVVRLIRRGRHWFFSDLSSYVYYVPIFWKLSTPEKSGSGD